MDYGLIFFFNPSAIKLNPRIVKRIATPGNTVIHQAIPSVDLDSIRILPQLGVGGCTPNPRKLKPDSIKIAPAIPRVAFTNTGPTALGIKCLLMILKLEAPSARSA